MKRIKVSEKTRKRILRAFFLFFLTQGILSSLWIGKEMVKRVVAKEVVHEETGENEMDAVLKTLDEEEKPDALGGEEKGDGTETIENVESSPETRAEDAEIKESAETGREKERSAEPDNETETVTEQGVSMEETEKPEPTQKTLAEPVSKPEPLSEELVESRNESVPAAEISAEQMQEPEPADEVPAEEPVPAGEMPTEPAKEPEPANEAITEQAQEPETANEVPAEPYNEPEPVYEAPAEPYYEPEPAYEAPAEPYYEPEPVYEAPAEPYQEPEPVYEPEPVSSRGGIPWQGENVSTLGQGGCDRIRTGIISAASGVGASYSQDLQNAAVMRAAGNGGNAMDILTSCGGEGWRAFTWKECISYAYLLSGSEEDYADVIASLNAGWQGLVNSGEGWSEYGVGLDVVDADGAWLVTAALIFIR